MDLTIRPEVPGDAESIRAINEAAFDRSIEGAIVDGVRGTDRWIAGGSMVVEEPAGRLIGHLLLSEGDLVSSDPRAVRRIWMVGPVAVMPESQRRGVGSALMHAAIELATARGQPVLCLLGHAGYYPRFGFEPARGLGIQPPRPWPDGNWLALRLPAWDPSVRGLAQFPPAFPDASGTATE